MKSMEMAALSGKMDANMLASGSAVTCMDMAVICRQIRNAMKDNMPMIRNMDMEYLYGKTVGPTKASGRMVGSMAQQNIKQQPYLKTKTT